MKRHVSYPKIHQFRNVITDINHQVNFIGLDENGEPQYDPSISKPTLTFKGTVKLHGTNASVCFNAQEGLWVQSRQNIIALGNDNAGFCVFVNKYKEVFLQLIHQISDDHSIDKETCIISIYGEWAGKGIQKGVGINQLDKAFYIFGVKISGLEREQFDSYWVSSKDYKHEESRIFNIEDFETFSVDVDFNMPQLAQEKLAQITEQVEKECPVAKAFGIENGTGEGVVWSVEYKQKVHRFKVKGEKHSVTKVKKLASVDVEKLKSIQEFVNYSVTENRFNQAIENTFGNAPLDVTKMGDLIRWVVKDIMSEESDTLTENGLEPKDVNKYISNRTREMFFEQLDKEAFLN
ncbi:MAG: RNA ligase family protein [Flavobacteriales bacterium]|nr:RNA ligase family protein [Flavobacteriales bacterium]